ncbi:hypothetical protein PMKS-000093 [Pichia membranifaciens]|uniref:Uncharacterized protein n=1 Tax=Pichia membranifaciens TaxID=4926 RepID=A0A1Q2YAS3_9ASCO|nr:hypothetical protein PMKS-000093 [Pichia membranifaciens]
MLSPSPKKSARKPDEGDAGAGAGRTGTDDSSGARASNAGTPDPSGGILGEVRKRELENAISNSVLSPHNSVFEALHNPDLNRGVDLSSIRSKVVVPLPV